MTLAKTLRERRDELGLSLREVQRRTGISNAHLSQIETGKIERPEISLLFELARLYDLDLVDLMHQAGHLTRSGSGPDRAMTAAALRAVGELPAHQTAEALNYLRRLSRRAPAGAQVSEHNARRRVESIAERTLRVADAVDVIPTPLREVGAAAGVMHVRTMKELPSEIEEAAPRRWKKVLGAAVFADSSIYVDRDGLHGRRQRFTEAHEISHLMIPWHEAAYRLDDERQLFFDTEDELEAEANAAAAHLLFQGRRYHERAAALPVSIQAPIDLAVQHDASIHSSIRYFVEQHELPVAVLIVGRYTQFDGTLPIWQSFESDTFLAQYGRLTDHVPSSGLPVDDPEYVLGRLALASFETTSPAAENVMLQDVDGHNHKFLAESFFNTFTVFVMVSAKGHAAPRRVSSI